MQGIFSICFHFVVTDFNRYAVHLVRKIIPTAIISVTTENVYEYPGIRRVWELGQQIPRNESHTALILYFHSKGMSNGENITEVRSDFEKELFATVIDPWKPITKIFQNKVDINKVGYQVSDTGFLWYNFWWARASYIHTLVCPIVIKEWRAEQRFYYEQWLCMLDDKKIWPHVHSIEFPADRRIWHGIPSGKQDCLALKVD